MMWLYFAFGVMTIYVAHKIMLQQNGYRYMKDKYGNSLGRVNITVKIHKKRKGGQY